VSERVRIRNEVIGAVKVEAEAAYPYECCGFLLGSDANHAADAADAASRTVEAILAVKNEREGDPARRRFSIGPQDYLAAERKAEETGLDLVGIYHSHPDHPAVPSETDLAQAEPWYTYLIVTAERGAAGDVAAWRLAEDRSAFAPEEIKVVW